MESYADAGNTDRLYGEEFPLLAACGYTIERAGPRLLGLDIASIASEEWKSQINTILATAVDRDRLVTHMLRGSVQSDEQISRLQNSLDEFETGLMRWPKP